MQQGHKQQQQLLVTKQQKSKVAAKPAIATNREN